MGEGPQRRPGRKPSRKAALVAALVPVLLISFVATSYADFPVVHRVHNDWAHAQVRTNICMDVCPQTQVTTVVVHQINSDKAIFICELQHPGDRTGRAKCVLDIIRYVCGADPLPPFPFMIPQADFARFGECGRATSYSFSGQMASAISLVTGSYECLRYVRADDYSNGTVIHRQWSAVNSGTFGCPG